MKEYCAALTIAGSDPGGGAGIQADLKTFSALGVFGTAVITAVTAQNMAGVTAVEPITPGVVQKQLIAVLEEFPIKAVKTGMLYSAEIIGAIVEILSNYRLIPLILDPVLTSTTGSKLLRDDALDTLVTGLFPLAALITPNIPEAEILTGLTGETMENMTLKLYERFRVPVLLKGGHRADKAEDVLMDDKGVERFNSQLIGEVKTHGSGCTLASAIAAAMARGEPLRKAVGTAKAYMTETLRHAIQLTPGLRVINHFPAHFE